MGAKQRGVVIFLFCRSVVNYLIDVDTSAKAVGLAVGATHPCKRCMKIPAARTLETNGFSYRSADDLRPHM